MEKPLTKELIEKRMDISTLYENKKTFDKIKMQSTPYNDLCDALANISDTDNIIFYGIGDIASQLVALFEWDPIQNSNYIFCDKKGDSIKEFHGFPVITPEILTKQYSKNQVVITLFRYQEEVHDFLVGCGIAKENIIKPITESISDFLYVSKKMVPQQRLSYFVLNILDHCNLNCQCCDHFACIAEKRFVDFDDIKKDVIRMAEILKGDVERIGVMGGEPLLHPDLLKILAEARKHFPNTNVQLVTNGLLLLKQTEDFWTCCRENRITIVNTKYPLTLDYDKMAETAKKHGVTLQFYGDTGEVTKVSYKVPLDLLGEQHPVLSFCHCFHSNTLPLMMEGKLYACTVAPNVRHFNQKFGTDLKLESGDVLEIHQETSPQEILDFLSSPKPFCRYCATTLRLSGIPWATTKRVMSEWLP